MSDINRPMTFSSLSTGLGLMSGIPAWPAVAASVERMRDARSQYSESSTVPQSVLEDLVTVGEFQDVFEESSGRIGGALVLAALLGRAAEVPDTRRIRQGLAAMSTLLDSERGEIAWDRVTELLYRQLSNLFDGREDIGHPGTCQFGFHRQWISRVKRSIRRVSLSPEFEPPRSLETSVAAAWKIWRARLAYDRIADEPSESRVMQFELDDVISATAQCPPATVLPLNLGQTTLRCWSRMLFDSLKDVKPTIDPQDCYCPAWLAIPAIRQLGLPQSWAQAIETQLSSPRTRFRNRPVANERPSTTEHFPPGTETFSGDVFLLISPEADGGHFADWKNSPDLAAVIVTPDEFESLPIELIRPETGNHMFSHIVYDYMQEDTGRPEHINQISKTAKKHAPFFPNEVWAVVPDARTAPSIDQRVIAPESLKALAKELG